MPSLPTNPPAEGTYRFVLQRPRLAAIPGVTHPIRYSGYEESRESIGIALPGEPMRHTIFCNRITTRDRAVREGWRDITQLWTEFLDGQKPKLSTDAQIRVHSVLTDDWQDKKSIVQLSGISDSEWRTTVKLLEERGLVSLNLGPNQRRKASNRSYRYKRGPRWHDAMEQVNG